VPLILRKGIMCIDFPPGGGSKKGRLLWGCFPACILEPFPPKTGGKGRGRGRLRAVRVPHDKSFFDVGKGPYLSDKLGTYKIGRRERVQRGVRGDLRERRVMHKARITNGQPGGYEEVRRGWGPRIKIRHDTFEQIPPPGSFTRVKMKNDGGRKKAKRKKGESRGNS